MPGSRAGLSSGCFQAADERAPWNVEEARIREAYARRPASTDYSWFNRAHQLASQEIEGAVLDVLARCGHRTLGGLAVLDVGCGRGTWLRNFVHWGADPDRLAGVDLLPERIAEARRLCPQGVTLICGSGARLDFADGRFDIVLHSMLFSSVLDGTLRRAIATEMLRVLRPDGLLIWYDFHVNNPANPDVRGVSRREIRALFPGCRAQFQRITLAAPLARWVAPRSRAATRLLAAVPLLRTHYLAAIRKDC